MILTVTLNANLDKTLFIPEWRPGEIVRVREKRAYAGGKGLNASRILRALGEPTQALALLGGYMGQYIGALAEREGLPMLGVPIAGEARDSVTIVEDSGRVSQYLEPGPSVTPAEMDAFRAAFRKALTAADWLVISGSTPNPDCDVLYPECIALAKAQGVPTLLDSSASALRMGVAAAPFAVKPNAQEAALFLGHEAHTPADALQAAAPILAQGVQVAVISLGPQGAVAVSRDEAWHAQPPEIKICKAIACGDSLVGALAYAWHRGLPLPEVLRWGVAAGTANAAVWDPAACTRAEIEALLPQVTVTRL